MKAKKIVSLGLAIMFGASVMMTGCGNKIDSEATLITINDGEDTISLGYGNFMARYQQSMYDQYLMAYYGEDMWSSDMSGSGSTLQDETKDGVITEIEEQYLCRKHADEYGVALSDDDNAAIAEAAKSFMESNPEDTIEVMGATEELVTEYIENRTYETRVTAAIKEAAGIEITDEECWQRTFSYVLFNTASATDEDGNEIEITDEYIADQKEQAEALAAAEDFDEAAAELSVSTHSYTKGEEADDMFDMTIIDAAEKLSEGEVSDVIEIEGTGYYVIRLDSEHDEEASETERESLKSTAETNYFDEIMQGWKDETTFDLDEDAWEKVQFDTLFKAVETEEETTETEEETTETEEDTTETEDDTTETEEDATEAESAEQQIML